ncbi:MAG: hypothetical protein ACXWCZ_11430 [Flavisolibacter sp.]
MKSFSFRVPSLLIGILFFLSACNNSSDDNSDVNASTDTSAGTTTETSTAPVNTIITQPQGMFVVRHKVKDFDAWKTSFEANDSLKLAHGLHNYVVCRGVDDPNMVLVALKADDMAKAKAFAKSPDLKKAMQKSGVTGNPIMSFVTITWQDTVQLPAGTLRSLTSFKVKDWAEWEKNFKAGEQERMNNGITVRQYGYEADDNKKVSLVTALSDTAKAHAYWKSDALKQRRAAGGVIGEPERFVFRIVQRY